MKPTFFNIGKGTNFSRNLKSESCVGVVWEDSGCCVVVVKELGDSLTFICI